MCQPKNPMLTQKPPSVEKHYSPFSKREQRANAPLPLSHKTQRGRHNADNPNKSRTRSKTAQKLIYKTVHGGTECHRLFTVFEINAKSVNNQCYNPYIFGKISKRSF